MSSDTMALFQDALNMFIYLGVELTALFLIISFIVGVIQHYLPDEKIQAILSAKSGKGYVSAALLGSVTPFCSCSTIPMLTGLLKARAGFGPTLTFLFTSPLLNPIILGLFLATFGWSITLSYALIALTVSITASFLLDKLGFERYVRQEAFGKSNSCSSGCGTTDTPPEPSTSCCDSTPEPACCDSAKPKEPGHWQLIWQETWAQFKSVLPYLLVGIAIGSLTYGFMPADLVAQYAGADNLLAVPVAAVIGVPLYIRAEAVIPLSAALATKGMGMGAIMALIIGSAGASITEVILLRSLFKNPMILAFLGVIFGMAIFAGFFFNQFF